MVTALKACYVFGMIPSVFCRFAVMAYEMRVPNPSLASVSVMPRLAHGTIPCGFVQAAAWHPVV